MRKNLYDKVKVTIDYEIYHSTQRPMEGICARN